MIIKHCEICDVAIKAAPSQEKTKRFCSKEHRHLGQSKEMSGKNNPQYKGGFAIYTNGKKRIKSTSMVYILGSSKKKAQHRAVAEDVLGRDLKRHEHVHHINGDQLDNQNSNLLICTVNYHRWLHEKMARSYMKEHFS